MDVLGNRGKCAQPCRLPYELIENEDAVVDKGYLLSTRDLCSLEYMSDISKLGISSLKIEGRMKTPDYVATATRIYRNCIDIVSNGDEYSSLEKDKKDLLQIFNRGGFSTGHLNIEPNRSLVYPDRPDNIGIYVGNISNYNDNKGHITIELNEPIAIGDSISIEGETGRYTVSELMINDRNYKNAEIKSVVKLGRMKGNIKIGSKVYKLESKSLSDNAKTTYLENSNIKKVEISAFLSIHANKPITMKIKAVNQPPFYNNITVEYKSSVIPEKSINNPLTEETVVNQISKLGSTPYSLKFIDVDLDDSLYVNISDLNAIRREAIEKFYSTVLGTVELPNINFVDRKCNNNIDIVDRKISVLLENINTDYDYSNLNDFDNLYIPLKFLANKKYADILLPLSNKFNMYIYMPTIIKANYKNLLLNNLDEIVQEYHIKGFIISNIAGTIFLDKYIADNNYEIIANYTMNVFNNYTINELSKIGINIITPSIELNTHIYDSIFSSSNLPIELVAYGRAVLMNISYCLLGKTNKCYPECQMRCSNDNKYYLKDRLGLKFRIIPDNLQTVTSIYNSKITSIDTSNFNFASVRINILDENVDEINRIIDTVKTGKKLEGNDYTNGNLNRDI